MSHSGHAKHQCVGCDEIYMQCRCMEPDKPIIREGLCTKCKSVLAAHKQKEEQTQRKLPVCPLCTGTVDSGERRATVIAPGRDCPAAVIPTGIYHQSCWDEILVLGFAAAQKAYQG